ncbi:ankyrin repeat-containing domain protein [Aspergillus taichungensis]|uniref:Ankyrin repeat-containing domain protein n=1 Tax=Aspergillus taichungensis TaxID=482145 RepID=A0A2J5HM35_9EURO|nr:ankyrin repeat-containing domain protein [Aspergillus taichungensis]
MPTMESERGQNNQRTFHNTDSIGFQAVHQTINTERIVFNDNRSKKNDDIDDKFLSSTAFPTMHQRRDNVSKPHTDTCKWIVELEEYQHWVKASRGLLWIKGKPGAGKSTLMAFLYQQIIETGTVKQGIALEFFFNARGDELQHTPLGMLRSLLNQLYRQDPHVRPGLNKIYQDKCYAFGGKDQCWDWQQPYLEKILLEYIVASAQRQPLIVFVDALDEAGSENAEHVAEYFHEINESIAGELASGKICISCRHYPVATTKRATEITVEDHNQEDIAAYVHHHLHLDLLLPTTAPDYLLWRSVITYLIRSANGLFQWVSLVVPLVKRRIHEGQSPENTRKFLRTVPKKLEDAYAYILRHVIENRHRSRAYLLFLWVCLAERPLSVTEMRYAISARDIVTSSRHIRCDETSDFPRDDEQMRRQIKALSGGLMEVVEMNPQSPEGRVQVVHQSVKDYILPEGLLLLASLDKQTHIDFSCHTKRLSHENIIRHCQSLIYYSCLNYIVTESIYTAPTREWEVARKTWPLLEYATDNMFLHATNAGECRSMNLENEILLLQQATSKWVASSKYLHFPYDYEPRRSVTLLHIASANNLPDITDCLLSKGVSVDERDSDGNTALHHAAGSGNAAIAELLLHRGADITAKNLGQRTPLAYAASKGHEATVKVFLSKGLDVDEPFGIFGSALHQASIHGFKEIVQMLLDAGADVNTICKAYGTALQAVSYYGPSELGKRPHVPEICNDIHLPSIHSGNYEKPWLSNETFTEIMQILLKAGADVNIMSGKFNTPLQAASDLGSVEKIQLLLHAGANVNISGGLYGTALQAASHRGFERIVQLLLDAGADVNIVCGEYGTALQAASHGGFARVVQLLLDSGADANIVCGKHGTPVVAAAQKHRCPTEVIRLLLNHGADLSIPAQNGQTLAHIAARRGLSDIITMISPASVLLSRVDHLGKTPLHLAVYYGHLKTAATLAKYLDHPPGMDIYGRTPLDWAQQDQAMIQRLHEDWPVFTFTPDETRVNVLRESVRKLVKYICRTTNQLTSPGLFELGRCLLFLKMTDDARVVFSMIIQRNLFGYPQTIAYCYSCLNGRRSMNTFRFICETCAELGLCHRCKMLHSQHGVLPACQNHTFFEIPYQPHSQPTSISSNDLKLWLQDFLDRFEEETSENAVCGNQNTNVDSEITKYTARPVLRYSIFAAILLGSSVYMLFTCL